VSRHGEEEADILFTHNPQAIIDGGQLAGGKQIREDAGKHWWQFWRASS
jgi:hypothetical protein